MLVEVLLLAFNIAIHDDAAIVTIDGARFETDGTDREIGTHILSRSHLVWHQVLVVSGIGICTEIHQELSNILRASHGSEMQRCIAIVVCDVGLGPVFQQKL